MIPRTRRNGEPRRLGCSTQTPPAASTPQLGNTRGSGAGTFLPPSPLQELPCPFSTLSTPIAGPAACPAHRAWCPAAAPDTDEGQTGQAPLSQCPAQQRERQSGVRPPRLHSAGLASVLEQIWRAGRIPSSFMDFLKGQRSWFQTHAWSSHLLLGSVGSSMNARCL